ncbi:hypothetical protein FRAAL1382 [Frankia alni ACN14a]|uniref:Uncharacterized protein n=1 Tax=Frankia alni (strain DSM 45986 / CECT 9034 / ACN14a) TaxID=326424 RepID=Q0RQY2_FRAAA|nr:hypothetical protein FRAAL1382 [Frankia alni ACN14a]
MPAYSAHPPPEDTVSDQRTAQHLLDLAAQVPDMHQLTQPGLEERFGASTDVEVRVGQVWRARWDETVMLLVVLAVRDREVQGAPVTIDPSREDDHGIVVGETATAFGVAVTVWAGLTATVPNRVLDQLVDVWSDSLVRCIAAASVQKPAPLPAVVRRGRKITSPMDPSAMLRAELTDDLELLRQAPGLPVAVPGIEPRTLAAILGSGLDLGAFCASLNVSQAEAMRLLRGKVPMTMEQIDLVAKVTGVTSGEIASSVRPLPAGLVIRMEHPRWRSTWTRRARRLGIAEERARLDGSYGAFSLAARETGGGEPDWDSRLRQFLNSSAAGEEDA